MCAGLLHHATSDINSWAISCRSNFICIVVAALLAPIYEISFDFCQNPPTYVWEGDHVCDAGVTPATYPVDVRIAQRYYRAAFVPQ